MKTPPAGNANAEVMGMAKKKQRADKLPTHPANETQKDDHKRKMSVGVNKRGGQSTK